MKKSGRTSKYVVVYNRGYQRVTKLVKNQTEINNIKSDILNKNVVIYRPETYKRLYGDYEMNC